MRYLVPQLWGETPSTWGRSEASLKEQGQDGVAQAKEMAWTSPDWSTGAIGLERGRL